MSEEQHPVFTGGTMTCQCHACTQARRSQLEKALEQPVEMTSLRDIRQKLEALVEMRADDERWRKLVLEALRNLGERVDLYSGFADALRQVHVSLAALNGNHAGLKGQLVTLDGKLAAIGNCLAGLLTLGAKRSTKRKPRGRRK
jgi:hypothetical protein